MSASHFASDSAIPAPFVWADVVSPESAPSPQRRRAEWLTPYAAETIAEDALRRGPGARLEIAVPRGTSRVATVVARNWFRGLPARGIEVMVRLAGDVSMPGTTDTSHGACP